jgi:hypothetical protein
MMQYLGNFLVFLVIASNFQSHYLLRIEVGSRTIDLGFPTEAECIDARNRALSRGLRVKINCPYIGMI